MLALRAALARGGGHAHPEEQCQGGREAGSAGGRRAPAAGEGGVRPQGTASVGAVLVLGAVLGSGSPLSRDQVPADAGVGAEPLGQEMKVH